MELQQETKQRAALLAGTPIHNGLALKLAESLELPRGKYLEIDEYGTKFTGRIVDHRPVLKTTTFRQQAYVWSDFESCRRWAELFAVGYPARTVQVSGAGHRLILKHSGHDALYAF